MLRIRERINTWPGFVDLFSNLVIILIFLLIVFVFLWTTTNVFNTASGAKKIATLQRANAEKTEMLKQLTNDENEARSLLIMARDALTDLEKTQVSLKQNLATLSDENALLGQQIASKNDMLEKLIGDYERALREMQSDGIHMTATIKELESQLRAESAAKAEMVDQLTEMLTTAGFQDEHAINELEMQKQSLLAELQRMNDLLTASEARAEENEIYYVELSNRLNKALADKIAELNELNNMSEYQSEFYSAIRSALAGMRGVDVSGDRFVIPSDILFPSGSFTLSPEGKKQLTIIANIIKEMEGKIPTEINWIVRIDGHTDKKPVIPGTPGYKNNLELSLLRARAVVNELAKTGVSKRRLVPSGFGEMYPMTPGTTPADLQKNRRIELRLTNP